MYEVNVKCVREALVALNYNQHTLAQVLSVRDNTITNLMQGKAPKNRELRARIARVLGLKFEDIFFCN